MNQFKISTRLTALVGILSLMLILGAAMGLYGISKTADSLKTVYVDRTVPLGQLAEMSRVATRNAMLIGMAQADPLAEAIARYTKERVSFVSGGTRHSLLRTWSNPCFLHRVSRQVGELARNQKRHGNEVIRCAIAPRFGFGGLQ
jgi:hypothetical protein